jgi:hypothetical protein
MKDPIDSFQRILDRTAEKSEESRPPYDCVVADSWELSLHDLLGLTWPCDAVPEFQVIWTETTRRLAAKGLAVGKGTYGGWDDADRALARAAWCLTRHLRPGNVIETGVGRGVTTQVILEALERNGTGHLWSVDLPPLLERSLREQIGAAVSKQCRHRWTYVLGSSRRRLPGLLARLGEIDLFLHDSMHTKRNVRFELDRAWPALTPNGVVLVDDVHRHWGFHSFTEGFPGHPWLIGHHDDDEDIFGIIQKASEPAGRNRR